MNYAAVPSFSLRFPALIQRRIHWLNLPSAILMVL
ncbi:MAG: hypothetical protein JWQ62_2074, partial [Lacunisphaera sp.]|nr:hypothetical protein [Lacunisphaera sp.]